MRLPLKLPPLWVQPPGRGFSSHRRPWRPSRPSRQPEAHLLPSRRGTPAGEGGAPVRMQMGPPPPHRLGPRASRSVRGSPGRSRQILGCHRHFGGDLACSLLPLLTPLRLLLWVQPWDSGSQTQTGRAVNCPREGFVEFQ